MAARYKIGSAPNGEDTSADGTEKFPVSGSKYMLISTVAAYIRTLTQTLTGKTINLTDNTLTGTKAQFNTAMSDADFATLTGTETLTNKTLTTPVISTITNTGTLTLPTTTDTIVGRATTDTLTNKTLTTPTISGAITFPDNVRQTFNPGADAAGLNVGSHAGDPGTPSNGDLWYDSTANELTARINGSNVALGAGGGGSVATDTIWDAKGDVVGGTGANTAARLAVGTDGQVLTADAAEATGLKWTTPGAGTNVSTDTIWDAKGDLAGGTGSNTAARLAVGTNGTALIAASGETTGMKWALPPGHEFDYAAHTAGNVSPTATTEGTADTIVTGNAVTYDGSTIVIIEFFANHARPDTGAAGRTMTFWLYEDGSSIGQIGQLAAPAAGTSTSVVRAARRITPTNASHTYAIKASVSAGTGLVAAGAGGSGNVAPAFIRITKAN